MAVTELSKKRKLTENDPSRKAEKSKKIKATKDTTDVKSNPEIATAKSNGDKHAKKKLALSTPQNSDAATTKPTKANKTESATPKSNGKPLKSALKKSKPTSAPIKDTQVAEAQAQPKAPSNFADFSGVSDQEAGEKSDEDARTAALLKGFESSDSESDSPSQNIDTTSIPNDAPLPSIPASASSALQTTNKSTSDGPGTLYIGRIPHGFYEHQMRAYFSQFGSITRLRLSRNPRTGASRHYAFLEFASAEVAKIVADTMDNYLMFGHILRVRVVPPEQVHAELWKGAGRRFKKIPWRGIERGNLKSAGRETWGRRIKAEGKRRKAKNERMKELGYVFEMPELRAVESVPVREAEGKSEGKSGAKAIVDGAEEGTEKAVVEAEAEPSKVEKKKSKKTKAGKGTAVADVQSTGIVAVA